MSYNVARNERCGPMITALGQHFLGNCDGERRGSSQCDKSSEGMSWPGAEWKHSVTIVTVCSSTAFFSVTSKAAAVPIMRTVPAGSCACFN